MSTARPQSSLDRLWEPRSVAVLGASDNPATVGGMVFANLLAKYTGAAYPVNIRRDEVQGQPAYRTVDDLPEVPDLVVIALPAAAVVPAAERCAELGVAGAVVVSAGFSEVGDDGAELQASLGALCQKTGFRTLGPNCNGFLNAGLGLVAGFAASVDDVAPGNVTLVSQSGGFGAYVLAKALTSGLRIGRYASTGNEADLTVAQVLRHGVEHTDAEVFMIFSEALHDVGDFLAASEHARVTGKYIIAVKTGDSEDARRAALSHTASMLTSGDVFRAVAEQYGVITADSIEEMIDIALVLQTGKTMSSNSLGVLTVSGGAGVLIADEASKAGLRLPEFSEHDQARIAAWMPDPALGATSNPVDTTGQLSVASPELFGNLLQAIDRTESVSATISVLWEGDTDTSAHMIEVARISDKPLLVATIHPAPDLVAGGVPTFADPARAVRALGRVYEHQRTIQRIDPGERGPVDAVRMAEANRLLRTDCDKFLPEDAAKRLLALYGIPVCEEKLVVDVEDALETFGRIGSGSVVLKGLSSQYPHKSDQGLVRLNLRSSMEVADAYQALLKTAESLGADEDFQVLIQEWVDAEIEIACGIVTDPTFGPMVSVSVGGRLIEIVHETKQLRAPFGAAEAAAVIQKLAGGRLVGGSRGLTTQAIERLSEIMRALSDLALEVPAIASADINPIRVSGSRCIAVDALIVHSTNSEEPLP